MKSPIEYLKSEKAAMRKDWPQLIMPALVLGTVLYLLLFRSNDSLAMEQMTFQPKIDLGAQIIIPIQKEGAGPELNAVVAKFSQKCIPAMRKLGFGSEFSWRLSREICVAFSGQIDHETAGTWSDTIKGDGGCSTGLGQWNSCPASKRKAAKGIDAQMDQFIKEMGQKVELHPLHTAICLHNSPAGKCAVDHYDKNGKLVLGYVSKVKRSAKLFL